MPEPTVNNTGVGSGDTKEEPVVSNKIKIGTKEYDPDHASSALSLYEALQDPETGREIIETLAKRAGILDKTGDIKVKPGETKGEAESRAAKFLKKRLGADYTKFSDSIGPALDDLIAEVLDERFGAAEAATTKTNWDKAVDAFNDDYVLTEEIETTMKELMEDSPPNFNRKGFKADRYLGRIYKSACEELGVEAKTNRPAARSRSRSNDDELPDFVVRDAPKNVSIDDAVEAAMKGIKFNRRA